VEFKIKVLKDGQEIKFSGSLNERADKDLQDLIPKLATVSVFNLQDLTSINSSGVIGWLKFMTQVGTTHKLIFEHCSPEFVDQMNMIPDFRMHADIRSVQRYYLCNDCGSEGKMSLINQIDFNAYGLLKDSLDCPRCKKPVSFADNDEDFFNFAKKT
jgi:hypothetical protein